MNNPKIPSNRNFGIVFCIVFFLVGIYFFFNDSSIFYYLLSFSLLFLILGLANSKILTIPNKLWFRFGLFLGKIISPVVMGLIFFLVVTPIAIIMKILKKDLLNLNFNNNKSYWIKKDSVKSNMKKQF
ncbi:SxtJ family membrane protein [Candidatus Pelagibacter communis]|uniref:SxtJ family membrane protein n=1 Tax=Pelagibacter ubique TaxID=198252 RepID=UPI00094CE99B|nr:SxtJ family membrane protein [Candidatus Pelagibacter ubique]|tara:strand:- start:252 stop:635 length:384 start_codon:yes stop_codon:yes gene_type:complete